ncbi:DUF3558 domain-containing protein [Allosaccharopolyspora coralli]|uniref:DUF3558 domain-containing protein n=1 Tax=Allosaccharopolyspora coralli TaxID=2665642 RepID=A0A5Q3QEB6_9PSEU|nr:DUF3558 domain-containing protein [Allosaccharopolyspora coralli]QGK71716.1 DUF3558 domain-containing protein [Allosaccharopolyspora coralli]
MNRRLSSLVLAVVAVAGLAAGCGSSDRPRDLSLDEVQPCDLISQSELNALQVTAQPSPVPAVSGADEKGSTCMYSPRYGGTVRVSVVTNHGIDRWTGGSMSSKAKDLPRIQGYRTILVSPAEIPLGPRDLCRLYVDVAGGQSLRAIGGPGTENEPSACEKARQFAEVAVRSLAQQAG